MLEPLCERDVAECLRPGLIRVARVRDPLAVLDAVAGVVEPRARRVGARVEGGRGGHHLEGRARRIETRRRVVLKRRVVAAGSLDLPHLVVAVRLHHEVRVVRRRRGHCDDRAGLRIEHHDRAAAVAELVEREPLDVGAQGEIDVVPVHRLAAEAVQLVLERVGEVRVRAGQVVVERLLEPGRDAALRRVAGHLRREVVLRVVPREGRQAVLVEPAVRREDGAVGSEDLAAVDREPLDLRDPVVIAGREVGLGPRLPVGGRHEQGRQQDERDDGDVPELPVHARASSRFARFETSISPATSRKLATTLEPP